ncbi:MAG: Nramp family divalent metal transporter [Betaproteobacteria bacterium]|nr:Nramp family divalent metal transporter [Betaproteobacteria bacterium]MDE2046950.1 Nramp family divalent metal transporter [Betaproteobacteria bacterium]
MTRMGSLRKQAHSRLKSLGPGLVTGAADDDPSGIATYSQAGAQFGTGVLWTTVLTTPLMVAIQMVSARIGWVTGRGIAANLRERYPRGLVLLIVSLLVIANTINLGADLGAMASAAVLLTGQTSLVASQAWLLGFAVVSLVLQIWLPFPRYSPLLKALTFTLLAYAAVLFSTSVDWLLVLRDSLWPRVQIDANYWMVIVGVLGTTISPYLFFWQASQEAEEHAVRGDTAPFEMDSPTARSHLRRIRLDTWVGMLFSNIIAFCIMLTTAVTLHSHGITDIQTTEQAARALRPLVGDWAYTLFTLGIIGTGLLAVPVLAGSAAYALAEALGWPAGLNHKPGAARGFYLVLTGAVVVGAVLDFNKVDPIKELLWSAVINGVVAVPIMVVLMHMAGNREVLGRFVIGRRLRVLGTLATVTMAGASVAFLWTTFFN